MLGRALLAAAVVFLQPLALIQGQCILFPKASMGEMPWEVCSEHQPGEGML